MATGYKIKLYNLPQRVEGGLKIHGLKDDKDKDIVVLFHHLDGMYSYCTIEGTDKVVHLSASTPLITLGKGEYKIDEEKE
jgi:hypothetical protein